MAALLLPWHVQNFFVITSTELDFEKKTNFMKYGFWSLRWLVKQFLYQIASSFGNWQNGFHIAREVGIVCL